VLSVISDVIWHSLISAFAGSAGFALMVIVLVVIGDPNAKNALFIFLMFIVVTGTFALFSLLGTVPWRLLQRRLRLPTWSDLLPISIVGAVTYWILHGSRHFLENALIGATVIIIASILTSVCYFRLATRHANLLSKVS